jgi:hypothetical protein
MIVLKKELDNRLKQQEEGREKLLRAYKKDCVLVYRTLKDNKDFLEMLERRYLTQPVSHYKDTERYACFREGENNIVRVLKEMFEEGFETTKVG